MRTSQLARFGLLESVEKAGRNCWQLSVAGFDYAEKLVERNPEYEAAGGTP
jgi:hypothetical protein